MNSVDFSKLSYRAEIDGLRAIAVISVILYHAQMMLFGKDWFEGGFIGVDIFFVISGYLITRIILSELQIKGSFSFLNFYERRARRILPMLLVVILASIPYAWQKLLPSAFLEYADSILASIYFGSNFFFYFNTTEYGTDSALLKPFLHTWSLSVEEQFYIVFPFITIIVFKFFRNYFLIIIFGLSLLSIHFAEIMGVRNSVLNFYLPFSRFWELAVGSILAYRELYYKTSDEGVGKRMLPMLGLYLIAYSILFFDSKTPHPGFYTLIPVVGAALIIGFASKDELVGKILGSKPFVWIGLISYSAYLWHFPIFAFSRMDMVVNNYDKFEWILLTFLLSIVSYFLVEKTFRNTVTIGSRLFCFILAAFISVIILMAVYSKVNSGFETRFPKIEWFSPYEIDNKKLRKESLSLLRERNKKNPDFLDVERKILLVGNSHSKDLYNAIVQNGFPTNNTDVLRGSLTQLACANENVSEYSLFRQNFYGSKKYKEATTIVVSTRYGKHRCNKKNITEVETNDIDGLKFLIKRAVSDKKKVIVFGNTAEFHKVDNKTVADYIYGLYAYDVDLVFRFDEITAKANELSFSLLTSAISENQTIKAIANQSGATYVDKVSLICDMQAKSCNVFTDEGFKIFYDYGHWTLEGAEFIGERLMKTDFPNLLR